MAGRDAVLVVNAGSSSLKFGLYAADDASPHALWTGRFEGLQPGGQPVLCEPGRPPAPLADGRPGDCADPDAPARAALAALVALLAERGVRPLAVAHRIVHGGSVCRAPCVLDDGLLDRLALLEPLAPLHQPFNLRGVRALRALLPDVPQVGCFDTAFHAALPAVETRLPLPRALADQGLRRYGFHGLSYQHLVTQLARRLGGRPRGRWLLAHLGSGASLCAVNDGQAVATTMGFSALDGLMMGSRCGALDPGVLLHLWRQGWTLPQVEQLLWRDSGLRGVSGESADMRQLRASGSAAATEAIALFNHRLLREAGALIACLGGLDLLAFTGGIGEHDAAVRASLARSLAHTGLALDAAHNAAPLADPAAIAVPVHAQGSAVQVWVVRCDEGSVAAAAARALVAA